ncbi:MAG: 6,7-dimethyl-8-ribityllumazine synthase [Gammaproteobacteria bacterium]
MQDIKTVTGDLSARDFRIAIVAARFNESVVDNLIRGAVDTLCRHGVNEKDILLVRVPGAFELPHMVRKLTQSKRHDAILALAAVIRGGTPHFEYVAGSCANGLANIASASDVPIAFGVLTCDSAEQAIDRAGGKVGNKGADAARAAIEMVNVARALGNS